MAFYWLLFLALGFTWKLALSNSKFEKKANMPNYKFSFARFCFLLKEGTKNIIKQELGQVMASYLLLCAPFLFFLKSPIPLIAGELGILLAYVTAMIKRQN